MRHGCGVRRWAGGFLFTLWWARYGRELCILRRVSRDSDSPAGRRLRQSRGTVRLGFLQCVFFLR
ncbi:hypothetical protein KJ567_05220 [Candidatus Bipolaricaulota bacterium]|nr:hypothetical protein [Candidatus Bipolaricaulota bacterium]